MNEIYKTSSQSNIVTRNPILNLRTKTLAQKCLSYLRPFIWNAAIIRTGIVGQVGHKARGTGSK